MGYGVPAFPRRQQPRRRISPRPRPDPGAPRPAATGNDPFRGDFDHSFHPTDARLEDRAAAYRYCPHRYARCNPEAEDVLAGLAVSVCVDQRTRSVGWAAPRAFTEAELDLVLTMAPVLLLAKLDEFHERGYERHYERADGWRVRDFMAALLDLECRARATHDADGRLDARFPDLKKLEWCGGWSADVLFE